MERVYSYNPGARTGQRGKERREGWEIVREGIKREWVEKGKNGR